MREIKFRGYDGMDWIYGSAVRYDSYTDTWHMIENGAPDDDWVMVGEIGQYTGIRDKNDVEIYEGDIMQFEDEYIARVFWNDELAGYAVDCGGGQYENLYDFTDEVVIGNIHDNPELIK
jgi:uncharacterized phage protein (TIGR01671 family)